ncbi:ATP-binding protein [Lysinibacillus sp. NPDC047702]|uniref:ATP-binding protein n=1 Tax=unclassified Lysinibacillus TaxID=2636778 RepID=UPI003CFC1744
MNITRGKVATAQKVVLYGPEGIGKSSLAAKFPEPGFIDTEGSTGNMDVARFDKPTSWTFMLQQLEYVKQNRPFKTLVIDTVDWAERMAIEHICNINQKASIEDFGYGSGYIKLEEEMGRFLNLLQDIVDQGINLVLTAHAQIRKFEQPDEMGAYDRYELKLGKKTSARTSSLVKEWADMVLFINYKTYSVATDDKGRKHKAQGGTRTMFTTHHPAWDAKNRHGLPDELPLDYAHISHIFENNVSQKQPVQQYQQSQSAMPIQQPTQVTETWSSQPTPEQQAQYQQPVQETMQQPEPQQPTQPVQQQEPVQQPQLNPAIPASLRDLMMQSNVAEHEIQAVVGQKGYYPQDTPMTNYDPGFIDGVLVGAWQQVYGMVLDLREQNLPF